MEIRTTFSVTVPMHLFTSLVYLFEALVLNFPCRAVRRAQGATGPEKPRRGTPLDLARGAGVPSLPKSGKQASENGKGCLVPSGIAVNGGFHR
jgi:hypothetical protein